MKWYACLAAYGTMLICGMPASARAGEFEEMELKAAALVKAVLLTLEKRA